jgi:hypothetical protein
MRKGDIGFDAGVIMVSRSHDRDIPKGWRVEAVPINEELVPYSRRDDSLADGRSSAAITDRL